MDLFRHEFCLEAIGCPENEDIVIIPVQAVEHHAEMTVIEADKLRRSETDSLLVEHLIQLGVIKAVHPSLPEESVGD